MSSRLQRDEALEKEDRTERQKKQQQQKTAHPSRTCCKHSRALPYDIPMKQDALALEATQHHRPTQPEVDY